VDSRKLSDSYRRRLAELQTGPFEITEAARLVHGSARDEDEYVVTQNDAVVNLALSSPSITFFGHTHEPGVFTRNVRWTPSYEADGSARLRIPGDKILVNPGSVGQPRDGDSRASFVIWTTWNRCSSFIALNTPSRPPRPACAMPSFQTF
jgi:predicted phosphodiesterase